MGATGGLATSTGLDESSEWLEPLICIQTFRDMRHRQKLYEIGPGYLEKKGKNNYEDRN